MADLSQPAVLLNVLKTIPMGPSSIRWQNTMLFLGAILVMHVWSYASRFIRLWAKIFEKMTAYPQRCLRRGKISLA